MAPGKDGYGIHRIGPERPPDKKIDGDGRDGEGREQRGQRPVLVVSADAINSQPLGVTVVVGTSADRVGRDYPTNVRVRASETGLPNDTVFYCFQIRSLDPSRFTGPPAGGMPPQHMREVEAALKLTLGL